MANYDLYLAALAAEKAFTDACVAEYGKDAGTKRYSYNHPAHIAALANAKHAADKAWIDSLHAYVTA